MFMTIQTGVPCKWISDGKQFILDNFDTIQESPARIYDIAPTLCPSSSWLHEFYSTEFSPKVKAVVGSAGWGTCIRTLSCPNPLLALVYCNNTIVTGGLEVNDIIIFDAVTGSQITALSGHTGDIRSLASSLDGTLLVSGSGDKTIKLWDVQTGGVIKTFCGHTGWVQSVSISADNTIIASGSYDETIRLWNIKIGNCHIIVGQNTFTTVTFSPTNSQLLMSSSYEDNTVQQWSIDGHQIGSPVTGHHVAFSPDGTQFVSCEGETVTIRNTDSKIIVVEFNLAGYVDHCCFSPDGRCITVAVGHTIYLWDTTGHEPYLIQTLIGHTLYILSLVFASSLTLISGSADESVRFWQIGASLVNPVIPGLGSSSLTPAPIRSVSLQAKDGLAFSIDSEGVVKTWDIQTGCCKESYKTKAKYSHADMQLIGNRLIVVWHHLIKQEIHVWDAEKGELYTVPAARLDFKGLRILVDGSRFIQLEENSIQARSIWTGESVGKERLEHNHGYHFDPLHMDGPRVLVHSGESLVQGWDFGVPGSTPIQFSETSSERPHLNFIGDKKCQGLGPARIEDSVTGKVIFQLCGRYADPSAIRWDGQYLITGYVSGEVLILDFGDVLFNRDLCM